MSRFLNRDAQQQVFNMVYGDIDKAFSVSQSQVRLFYENRLLDLALKDLNTHRMHCLDLGCGRGIFTQLIRSRFRTITASDFAVQAVRTASRLVQDKHVQFLSSDGTALPFQDASFDCVIIKDFIHHLDHPLQALHEIHRVLRPGGILISVEPNNRNLPGQLIGLMLKHERKYIFNSPKFLIQFIKGAGFQIHHIAFDGFYIPYGPLIRIPVRFLPFLERFERWMQTFFPTGAGHFIACYQKMK